MKMSVFLFYVIFFAQFFYSLAENVANQFSPVYCRENALESRFGNLRDKIRPKFAYVCNSLTVSLLVVNMAIVCRKSIC